MNGDRAAEMAFLLLALTLPLSALIARRMPLGRAARLVAIWIVIIVGTVLLVGVARGGLAGVKAWLWPNTSDRTREGPITMTNASSSIFALHNIYYQDEVDLRRG